jgi:hypothetical protein
MFKASLHPTELAVRIFGLALFVAVLSVSLTTSAKAQDAQLSIQRIETMVKPVLSRWQVDRQILVDPRLVRVIAGGLWHFSEIYGWSGNDPGLQSRVTRLLSDEDDLYTVIDGFLEDCFSGDEIVSVFARAARAVGSSSEATGWPEKTPNGFVLVDFSGSVPKVPVTIISESLRSPDELVATGALVGAGEHEIVASDGRSWTFRAEGEQGAVDRASTGAVPQTRNRR